MKDLHIIDIGSGVPGECANVIRQDPENGSILYLGTDRAVYVHEIGSSTFYLSGRLQRTDLTELPT